MCNNVSDHLSQNSVNETSTFHNVSLLHALIIMINSSPHIYSCSVCLCCRSNRFSSTKPLLYRIGRVSFYPRRNGALNSAPPLPFPPGTFDYRHNNLLQDQFCNQIFLLEILLILIRNQIVLVASCVSNVCSNRVWQD